MNRYVTVEYLGGLGNNLFQIAAAMGVADLNDCPVILPRWQYQGSFPDMPFTDTDRPLNILRMVLEKEDYRWQDIKVWTKVCMRGYFQSLAYMPRDQMWKFVPKKPAGSTSRTINPDDCAIHVRRGDYLNIQHVLPCQTVDYYQQAKCLMGDRQYHVYTDDIDWCNRNHIGDYTTMGDPIQDLYELSQYNFHIISNSTFGWWGAWLAQSKQVICPKVWCRTHDTTELIPDDWYQL